MSYEKLLGVSDPEDSLFVCGDADDIVLLQDAANWLVDGITSIAGMDYQHYVQENTNLYVQQSISVI